MIAWRRLERPETGSRLTRTFVDDMMRVQDQPKAATIGPVDLVIGLANAWHLTSSDLLPAAGQDPTDPERIAIHRQAVIEATRRLNRTE